MSTKPLNITLVEVSTAAFYREAGLTPSPEHLLEEEFEHFFGRLPDEDDRAIGLDRIVRFQRALSVED